MARAVLKYGWEGFLHIVLQENLTSEEADFYEKNLIKIFKANQYQYGYNETAGGKDAPQTESMKRKSKRTIKKREGPTEKQKMAWKRMSELKKGTKLSEAHKKKISEGMKDSVINKRKVICVETDEIFESIESAAKAKGFKSNHISEVCSGIWHTFGGFHWIYLDDKDEKNWETQKEKILHKRKNYKTTPILCVETDEYYYSTTEMKRKTGFDPEGIVKCCKGE